VTITDALEASALRAFGSFGHRAVLAAGAGMDLILCANGSAAEGTAAMNGLRAAYDDGALRQAAFRAAVTRIIALRRALPA
jgi:beta-N-acetylhexosaminidase